MDDSGFPTRNHMRLEAQERKFSSTLITMLFSFFVCFFFAVAFSKILESFCFFYSFIYLMFVYIDKAFNVLLLQQFSFHFCFNIVVHTISSYKKESNTQDTQVAKTEKLSSVQKKNVFISVCECCFFHFAEVHFGSINLHERRRLFNKHFSHR